MNTTNNINNTVLDQDSTTEEYTQVLRGRYVTDITLTDMDADGYALTATLTLDNGTTLTVEANEGCMGCVNCWYHLENAYKRGNNTARIMNAHVEYSQDNNIVDGYEVYTIFVMVEGNQTQLPLATLRGDDGPGGYGTGFTLTVRPASCDHSGDA